MPGRRFERDYCGSSITKAIDPLLFRQGWRWYFFAMPFKKGQSGNPTGSRDRFSFLNALNRAIAQDDGKRLRDAAEQLLTLAAEGEAWAIRELADRLDGKPKESVNVNVSERPVEELSDAELLAIAAERSRRAIAAASSETEPDRVH